MDARIHVLGASGYLGQSLVAKLKKEEFEVIPVIRDRENKSIDTFPQDAASADLRDKSSLFELTKDSDLIVNTAGIVGSGSCSRRPNEALDVNSHGVSNLGYACRQNDVDLLHISSVATIGEPEKLPLTAEHSRNPLSHYGLTKLLGERALVTLSKESYFCPISLPTNIYGTDDSVPHCGGNSLIDLFIEDGLTEEEIVVHAPGSQARDFVHICDVAKALCEVVKFTRKTDKIGPRPFILGSGESNSIYSVATSIRDEIQRQSNNDVEISVVNSDDVGVTTSEYQIDMEFLKGKVGYNPSISLKEGISREVEQKVTG